MSGLNFEELIHPQSIAVAGASGNPNSQGYAFTSHLLEYGYKGNIYPVNPKYQDIVGIKAFPTIKDIPGPVDYVISCLPSSEVMNLLEDCSQKGVKCVHLFTARFGETGRQEGVNLEQEVLKQANKYGIRIIGPNCMGLYYPKMGLSFGYDFPKEPGPVGFASQSGGGAAAFINLAALRGIRFSKVISYGNALDLNESDFLDYYAEDPETKVILLYMEGIKDGRRFLTALENAASKKPVIITKGGRGKSGTRAVASHTASIAGSNNIWETAFSQMGAISVKNLEEMLDLAVSFCFLPPIKGPRVGISGAGGGPGVISADECEEAGLEVIPLPSRIREEIKSRNIPIWDWIDNPADVSILGGSGFSDIDMLHLMGKDEDFDLLIADMHELVLATLAKEDAIRARYLKAVEGYAEIKEAYSKPLMLIVREKSPSIEDCAHWSWNLMCEVRTKLLAAGIPFYPTIGQAAYAANTLIKYYRKRR
ncbi:acetate--CoA ligase family protein [Chloroflexota bacterium]